MQLKVIQIEYVVAKSHSQSHAQHESTQRRKLSQKTWNVTITEATVEAVREFNYSWKEPRCIESVQCEYQLQGEYLQLQLNALESSQME